MRLQGLGALSRGASSLRAFSSTPKACVVETEFDKRWRKMSDAEQEQVRVEWSKLNETDWRNLTLEQKKALYTIEYGPAETKDPYETHKTVGGVALGVGAGLALYALLRSFAAPAPHTMDPEWKKMEEETARQQNLNPIYNPDRRY